ncbi:MAG: hypothetical protein LIR50_00940 [Bacillota bacterium]|nr:hypothetical protein [Bacillota bacterium]
MDFILEVILGTIVESIVELWTNFMKKRNPDYNNNRFKQAITIIISIILILMITALFLGVLFLIEWVFPNLFDIVGFD